MLALLRGADICVPEPALRWGVATPLRAAVSDTPPTAVQVASALGPVLADLLGDGTISDVQRAFGDRSVFIFRPDALDIRLTVAIQQDGGSLLAVVLSRPEYLAAGEFFAASHSVSAEDQAHIGPGSAPVLWPDATGSLDFYNEHDEPSEEPASGSRDHQGRFSHTAVDAAGYGGYDFPEGEASIGSAELDEEVDADAVVVAEASEPEPSPEEPTDADVGGAVGRAERVDDGQDLSAGASGALSLLQISAVGSRHTAIVPTPFGRRQVRGPRPPSSVLHPVCQSASCHAEGATDTAHSAEVVQSPAPSPAIKAPDIVERIAGLTGPWDGFLRWDIESLPCLSVAQKQACTYQPAEGFVVARHVFIDGAFYRGRDRHKGGWAAVFVAEWCTPAGIVFAFDGYSGGPLIDFARQPLQAEYSSYDAEAAAMLVVLTWHLSQPRALIKAVHFDASAVGQAAEGLVAPRDPGEGLGLAGRARCVAQLLEAQGRAPTYSWVKGHAGVLWNEIADRIAKACAMETLAAAVLPEPFWDFVASRSLPWAWLVADRSGAFPDIWQISAGTYESPDPVPLACVPAHPEGGDAKSVGVLGLSLMSLNVQTLQNKRSIVLQQLQDKRTLLCGLQETRNRDDTQCNSGNFLEFASAAHAGDGGCTLLVSTTVPYVRVGDRPLCLARQHCRCVHAGPQLLAVEIRAPFFQCVCIVGHLPHTGRAFAEVQAWWATLANQSWFQEAGAVIMFLDANAQVGSVTSDAVGPHAQEDENGTGAAFREFLETHSLCVPATFHGVCGECMPSASESTWTSPRGFSRRIDYIVVPQAWRTACVRPRVDANFVTLNVDHRPVCLDVCAQLTDSVPRLQQPGMPRQSDGIAPDRLRGMSAALWIMPPVPWEANIHERTAYVYNAVRLGAQENGLFQARRRTRNFVSDEAISLLGAIKQCKGCLRQLDRLARKLCLLECFRAWRGDARPALSREGWSLSEVHRKVAICLSEGDGLRRKLRGQIRYDKGAYAARALAAMQASASPFAAKAFFRALRCLRPAGKRVLKPFGRLQITPFVAGEEPLAVRQQRHFAKIEAGTVLDAAAYTAYDSQVAHARPAASFDPALLPTLLQLECLFRGARQGKAPGPNGIPEWIWALDSRAAARAFLPIFLKSHFRLSEPVQFKSTALIALFKGKGSPAVLANHRAIALLDGPGKALRRSLRPTFVALLPEPDQQQGGTPGSLLAGAHHLVRAHQQLALGLKVPAAALFLDVSSAYYRVLRQAFGKGPLETDEDVAQLLALLQVPPSALREVCEWLSHTDLLAGAPAHCTALIRAFLSGTFFCIRGAPGIVRTRAGSRPGDSVADLLFSLVQADFLGSVRAEIADLATTDPVLGAMEDAPSSIVPVWADDAAVLLAQPTTPQLLQAAQRTLSVVGHGA